ncbi:MAG: phosphoribosylamine--glycine ligase [bacterium]|nr:phosphoribosylamine--glycine ligase [bacterium]
MNYPRRILIVGNGARECALANALLASERLERLWITPANWGVLDPHFPDGQRVEVLSVATTDIVGVVEAATDKSVDLVVIGPEAPLVDGLADALREAGILAFGPGSHAAQLEGSKQFAKDFMQRCGIPTADYRVFSDFQAVHDYIANHPSGELVLKADGLAAGKGVIVCGTHQAALDAASRIVEQREFGSAGDRVVVEERISGREISFTCLVAGGQAEVLPPSSDYKRLRDNDEGPNTGGMGNICPTPFATDDVIVEFGRLVLAPFMRGLREENIDYRGFLFVGAMLTASGLKVLEFNVRLGDPEAAVVLPLCEADWPLLFAHMAAGELPDNAVQVRDGACVAVVLATQNYPYGKSEPARIEGLGRIADRGLLLHDGRHGDVQLLFAGADKDEAGNLLATGGRSLTISARAESLSLARRLAYEVVGNIRFDGMQFRTDIGKLD